MDFKVENGKIKIVSEDITNCQHLFVKLSDGIDYYGFNSSDCGHIPSTVLCLKCGLTNSFLEMEDFEKEYYLSIPFYRQVSDLYNKTFINQFRNAYKRGGKSFDENAFCLISDEVFNVPHPILLYELAKKISPNADNEELFQIMKKLYDIETPEERLYLCDLSLSEDLIHRYKFMEGMVLKHEKK